MYVYYVNLLFMGVIVILILRLTTNNIMMVCRKALTVSTRSVLKSLDQAEGVFVIRDYGIILATGVMNTQETP